MLRNRLIDQRSNGAHQFHPRPLDVWELALAIMRTLTLMVK